MNNMKKLVKNWILPPRVYSTISKLINLTKKEKRNSKNKIELEIKQLLNKSELLKDIHNGKRCFILGAGSSILKQDLKKLAGEYVISVSNSFVHPDFHIFKPIYHVLPHLLHGHSQYSKEKFINWLTEMERMTFDAEMIFHIGDRLLIEENRLFLNKKIHWIEYEVWDEDFSKPVDLTKLPSIWSVSEVALSAAVYMGFDKIYLLGIDHDWFNGLFKYFFDEKTQHIMQPDKSKIPHVDAEFQMRRHAQIFKKYKYLYSIKKNIYNANANQDTYVDVFPKINFDSLF